LAAALIAAFTASFRLREEWLVLVLTLAWIPACVFSRPHTLGLLMTGMVGVEVMEVMEVMIINADGEKNAF
jgi:hypothetical protein